MFLCERHDREPADDQERRPRKQLFRLNGGQRLWVLESLAHLDAHYGHLGVAGVYAEYGSGADRRALFAGVVEDPLRSRFHFAQMLYGCRVGHAIPDGLFVVLEIVEGVDAGLGLEEEIGHGHHGIREAGRREYGLRAGMLSGQNSRRQLCCVHGKLSQ